LTVLVVDDHPVVHRGMAALLAGVEWVGRTVIAESVTEALAQATTHRPDLAVVDIRLPDGNGVDVVRQLGRLVPGCRALVLTMDAEPETVRDALDAGAAGYLLKDCEPELILDALSTLRHGGLVLGARALTALSDPDPDPLPAPFDRLNPREVTLAALVGAGLSNHSVATRLGVSEKTVRNQLSIVLVRVGARDRVHLAVLVRELGITVPTRPDASG
jgi:two-component system, NarL family, nitrate/nitrite response regulator NarL